MIFCGPLSFLMGFYSFLWWVGDWRARKLKSCIVGKAERWRRELGGLAEPRELGERHLRKPALVSLVVSTTFEDSDSLLGNASSIFSLQSWVIEFVSILFKYFFKRGQYWTIEKLFKIFQIFSNEVAADLHGLKIQVPYWATSLQSSVFNPGSLKTLFNIFQIFFKRGQYWTIEKKIKIFQIFFK